MVFNVLSLSAAVRIWKAAFYICDTVNRCVQEWSTVWFLPDFHISICTILPQSLGCHPYPELLLISRSEDAGDVFYACLCISACWLWEAGNLILCKTLYLFPAFISCHRTLLSFTFYILSGLYYYLFYVLMDNIYPYCFDVVVLIKSILLILWETCNHRWNKCRTSLPLTD